MSSIGVPPIPAANSIFLRDRLRAETRPAHDALDTRLAHVDVSSVDGLAVFLRMQARALGVLSECDAGNISKLMISDLAHRARTDLAVLGHQVPPVAVPPVDAARLHPDAVDYVLAGSRLGNAMLKKRWRSSTQPDVRHAAAFFTAPDYLDVWKSFCTGAGMCDARLPGNETIVTDARAVFALFSHYAADAAEEKVPALA